MGGMCLAVIMFSSSGSSALRTAQKIPQLIRSRFSEYFGSIILGQFSRGSFDLIISASRQLNGPVSRVRDCLVFLRYPRKPYEFKIDF